LCGLPICDDALACRLHPAHHVAPTTAGEVRDVVLLTQPRRNFARRLFHGRGFHGIDRYGGSPEPSCSPIMTISCEANEVNRLYQCSCSAGCSLFESE